MNDTFRSRVGQRINNILMTSIWPRPSPRPHAEAFQAGSRDVKRNAEQCRELDLQSEGIIYLDWLNCVQQIWFLFHPNERAKCCLRFWSARSILPVFTKLCSVSIFVYFGCQLYCQIRQLMEAQIWHTLISINSGIVQPNHALMGVQDQCKVSVWLWSLHVQQILFEIDA